MKTKKLNRPYPKWNQRQQTIFILVVALTLLVSVILGGSLLNSDRLVSNLQFRNAPPSLEYFFGTDWLGRDMFTRTIMGLTLSIGVGAIGAICSTTIAVFLGLVAATMGKVADNIVTWLIDLFLSVPHLVTLILIAFAFGGGLKGVVIGIALTHWPSLARVIRSEVMQLRSAEFVQISHKMGKSRWWIAKKHIMPHLIPQITVGILLLFPHAILHEAAVTFLGLGLSPHQPAVGIILSESMRYLSTGMWWLAFFPGICLLMIVLLFDVIGEKLRMLIDPHRAHH
ncbi:ABC transporter permease [Bacillus sp. Marseille-P3661]|uniref:ABC transporter permease n=1 Tax=Bacillus sp. Marseille-P3661 TaxID=1936234 RepID=UPI000C867CF5|nr:ABC transporter permease [Bacillus sp. Marseille-P3661]